ncbi:MAG: hypothetical protein AABZ43_00425, partial [Planctomycetota bacterium]
MIDTNILRAVILNPRQPHCYCKLLTCRTINPGGRHTQNPQSAPATQDSKLDKAAFIQKTQKLRIPFIANNGLVDERVRFPTACSGLQPVPSGLLNTDVCANDVISKD